jgi:hypothetical protein
LSGLTKEKPRLDPGPACLLPPDRLHPLVRQEHVDGGGTDRDDPVAGVALHRPGDGGVADGGGLFDDGDVAAVEVDVVVAQYAGFAAA